MVGPSTPSDYPFLTRVIRDSPHCTVPVELCLSFSFFFFLHFQGLKMRPRVASLLLRRMGGVWTPDTRQPVLSTLCWSTSSTTETMERKKWSIERQRVGTTEWHGVGEGREKGGEKEKNTISMLTLLNKP